MEDRAGSRVSKVIEPAGLDLLDGSIRLPQPQAGRRVDRADGPETDAGRRVAEQAGIPLGYATDVDLHADPSLLDGARGMVTLGHDEYWSTNMRTAATVARDHGVNLAFLGGNEVYRHIRFEATPLGPNRLEINYKSFAEDPYSKTDPLEATQDWRLPPNPRPESVLDGLMKLQDKSAAGRQRY